MTWKFPHDLNIQHRLSSFYNNALSLQVSVGRIQGMMAESTDAFSIEKLNSQQNISNHLRRDYGCICVIYIGCMFIYCMLM